MDRREKRVVKESGSYQVIEIEFFSTVTEKIVATSYEVRRMEKFLVEFEDEKEALMQLEYLLTLDGECPPAEPEH